PMERRGRTIVRATYDECWRTVESHASDRMRGHFVHPFDDDRFIAGNATAGLGGLEDPPGGDAAAAARAAPAFMQPRTNSNLIRVSPPPNQRLPRRCRSLSPRAGRCISTDGRHRSWTAGAASAGWARCGRVTATLPG